MTDLETHVRPASLSDMDDLVGLLRELFSVEKDFTFDETRQRRGLAMMLADTENRCVLVAERNRKAVGMCSVQVVISTAEGGKVGLVEDVVVGRPFRGNGIGKRLLTSMVEWARKNGLSRLQLLADQNNIPGLGFYRKMNWTATNLICLRKKL